MSAKKADNVPETFFANVLTHSSPGSLVIDVGANVGQFATAIARHGLNGICFEPAPKTCSTLQRNLAEAKKEVEAEKQQNYPSLQTRPAFGEVTVHCAAVGEARGTTQLATDPSSRSASFKIASAPSSSVEPRVLPAGASEQSVMTTVPILTLDETVPEDQPVLLLKTDTQGFEMGVLRGARRLLTRRAVRFLIVECSPYLLGRNGATPRDLMRLVAGFGYACTHLAFFRPKVKPNQWEQGILRFPQDPQCPAQEAATITFDAFERILRRVPPTNRSGWSDLFCWPA